MKRLYQDDSYLRSSEGMVLTVAMSHGHTELAVDELLFHPSGGGQPDDRGTVAIGGKDYPVVGFRKHKGEVYILIDSANEISSEIGYGDTIVSTLDWERRYRLMRYHSCSHVLMSSAKKLVSGYIPKGMQISDDLSGAVVRFAYSGIIPEDFSASITAAAKNAISADKPVHSRVFKGLDAARVAGGELFRVDPDLQLKGEVRVVSIDGFDCNPCGGTHVIRTGEIGGFEIESINVDDLISVNFRLL